MTRLERAADVAVTVARLAVESFAGFALSYDPASRVWSCRSPESGMHSFRLFFAPGVTFMWGDLGEFVWRHADADALGWFLAQGRKEERFPDYCLSKLRAVGGDKAREFFLGDAYAALDERIAEINATWTKEAADVDADDTETRAALAEQTAEQKKVYETVRTRLGELIGEQINEEQTCWYLAWCDGTGDSEPPRCTGWSSSALWAWHAVHVFARLHDEYTKRAPCVLGTEDRAAHLRRAMRSLREAPSFAPEAQAS